MIIGLSLQDNPIINRRSKLIILFSFCNLGFLVSKCGNNVAFLLFLQRQIDDLFHPKEALRARFEDLIAAYSGNSRNFANSFRRINIKSKNRTKLCRKQ